ncbi:flagellar hook-basal body complex protein FliE [Enterobacter sp.]|uniref:flagellar hook-basal body complex protein FliE n=1 Tax=Enterobacter sp. TaxID=42895 RepID=UPI00296E71F2|nr:flagellar hook-basal body complex protein FliE [Enterobacter sp.]
MTTITHLTGGASLLSMQQEMNRMKTLADAPVLPLTTQALASHASETSFQEVMHAALNHIDRIQQAADAKQNAVDSGQSDDLVGAMLASQEAALSFSALVQVRNKVTSGINDLMSMSV